MDKRLPFTIVSTAKLGREARKVKTVTHNGYSLDDIFYVLTVTAALTYAIVTLVLK